MIPKIIHYCWFGNGELSELVQKCIASWKRVLPEYAIKRWDEKSFDVNTCAYTKEAYEAKKYAFVSDYVRLYALYYFGGVYMDTDVEVLKPLDRFLSCKAFSGFEYYCNVQTGIIGSAKGYPCFCELIERYEQRHFYIDNEKYDLTTNVDFITRYYYSKGLKRNDQRQIVCGMLFEPTIVFCPEVEDRCRRYQKDIFTIHYKEGSWVSGKQAVGEGAHSCINKRKIKKIVKAVIGLRAYGAIMRRVNVLRGLDTIGKAEKKKHNEDL